MAWHLNGKKTPSGAWAACAGADHLASQTSATAYMSARSEAKHWSPKRRTVANRRVGNALQAYSARVPLFNYVEKSANARLDCRRPLKPQCWLARQAPGKMEAEVPCVEAVYQRLVQLVARAFYAVDLKFLFQAEEGTKTATQPSGRSKKQPVLFQLFDCCSVEE